MSDLTCVVCGEPWDAWGVRHGEMLRWEASLFLKGAGCPSCEGESPHGEPSDLEQLAGLPGPQVAFFRDRLLINPDDEDSSALFDAMEGNAPKWQEPEAPGLWSCTGCAVEVIRDPTTDYPDGPVDGVVGGDLAWRGGRSVHYSQGYGFHYGQHPKHQEPSEEPPHTIAEEQYCPGCATTCYHCGTSIFARSELEAGDPYDEGSAFLPDGYFDRVVCIPCLEEHYNDEEE